MRKQLKQIIKTIKYGNFVFVKTGMKSLFENINQSIEMGNSGVQTFVQIFKDKQPQVNFRSLKTRSIRSSGSRDKHDLSDRLSYLDLFTV